MRMGNLLGAEAVPRDVMSSTEPRLGVRHPTVVPANAESASASASEGEDESESENAEADGGEAARESHDG